MEFHEDDQEDHEEEEDDEGGWMGLQAASYDTSQLADSNPNRLAEPASAAAQNKPIRYKECRKNHAVGIGRHAVDGCGEFMASGAEGTLDALKCAVCNCHRNFHRKENYNNYPVAVFTPPQPIYRDSPPPSWYPLRVGPPHQHPRAPLALPSPAVVDVQEEAGAGWNVNISLGGGGGGSGPIGIGSGSSSRKRLRTKFSQEQKERMSGLAEKLGWRIQKHDEAEVERFCNENGIKRQVLKVWMHNNKHTIGKKP